WVFLGRPDKQAGSVPSVVLFQVPSSQRVLTKYPQECNFAQAIEGDIDDSHLSFLHRNLAELNRPEEFEGRLHYLALDRSPRLIVEPTEYGLVVASRRDVEADTYYWRLQHFHLPWYTSIWGNELDQRRFRGNIWIPVDDEHTEVWGYIWAPHDPLTDDERAGMYGGPAPHMATFDPQTGRLRANRANHYLQDRD